jgi:hypothetical protein
MPMNILLQEGEAYQEGIQSTKNHFCRGKDTNTVFSIPRKGNSKMYKNRRILVYNEKKSLSTMEI